MTPEQYDAKLAARQKVVDRKNGPLVAIKVTKRGDGKIATGEYDPVDNLHTFHEKGDVLHVPRSVADAQEEAGYAEILEGDEAPQDEAKRGPGRPARIAA